MCQASRDGAIPSRPIPGIAWYQNGIPQTAPQRSAATGMGVALGEIQAALDAANGSIELARDVVALAAPERHRGTALGEELAALAKKNGLLLKFVAA